jgi:hypothetical protein
LLLLLKIFPSLQWQIVAVAEPGKICTSMQCDGGKIALQNGIVSSYKIICL